MFATCLIGTRVQASLRKARCRSLFLSFAVHGLLDWYGGASGNFPGWVHGAQCGALVCYMITIMAVTLLDMDQSQGVIPRLWVWEGTTDAWLTDSQLRNFHTAQVNNTVDIVNGRRSGTHGRDRGLQGTRTGHDPHEWDGWSTSEQNRGRPTEKIIVPSFDGESGSEQDLGRSARSYIRKVQVWLRCTKLAPNRRALALYNELTGRAWVYAEELDVDVLASDSGVSYFLEWVQTRFMEVEITKVSNMMGDLFRRCKRRPDQSVRDFNVEFERLVLRRREVQCELPALVKGWLYLDKVRVTEHEELTLLSSVNNQFDARKLQQAALLQDRTLRKPTLSSTEAGGGKGRFGGKWRHTVHITDQVEESSEEEAPADEDGLVAEEVACEEHQAYMTYQDTKSKYRKALKGRGADMEEIKKRSAEQLQLAKRRSYCSACKRRGHWHKDPECPLRGRSTGPAAAPNEAQVTVHSAQVCDAVHSCYVTAENEAS